MRLSLKLPRPMDKKLLDILCCPASKQPLHTLPADALKRLNAAVAAGAVADVEGRTVGAPYAEALITADGKLVYRIDDGIPVLLADEAVAATAIDGRDA